MSNCLVFALCKWFRHGGYFIVRKSRHGFWFHFMWARSLKDAEVEHYVPVNQPLKYPLISKIIFKGRVKKKD